MDEKEMAVPLDAECRALVAAEARRRGITVDEALKQMLLEQARADLSEAGFSDPDTERPH